MDSREARTNLQNLQKPSTAATHHLSYAGLSNVIDQATSSAIVKDKPHSKAHVSAGFKDSNFHLSTQQITTVKSRLNEMRSMKFSGLHSSQEFGKQSNPTPLPTSKGSEHFSKMKSPSSYPVLPPLMKSSYSDYLFTNLSKLPQQVDRRICEQIDSENKYLRENVKRERLIIELITDKLMLDG